MFFPKISLTDNTYPYALLILFNFLMLYQNLVFADTSFLAKTLIYKIFGFGSFSVANFLAETMYYLNYYIYFIVYVSL